MKKTRFLAMALGIALTFSQINVIPVSAEMKVVATLGADLSGEQRQSILQFFGVSESEVEIITITNEDEREQLGGLIPLEKIGTRTFSCALVSPTTFGGIQVKTANMNYVTSNMIASTLSTSGVVNCDVLTAAPFEVSGTGALTGVMMAYETASGEVLDEAKKELANEELITTNNIADKVGQDEATLIVNDIKIHIIRDDISEQEEVNNVVDTVVDTTYQAAVERAAVMGTAQPAQLGQEEHEQLYTYGYKIGQMDYDYEDMQVTLERVTVNAAEAAGIDDPLVDTFETIDVNMLSADSILHNVNDEALGDGVGINDTYGEQVYAEVSMTAGNRIPAEPVKGVSFTKIMDVPSWRFVSDTNLVYMEDGSGNYAFGTVDGQQITEYKYTSVFYSFHDNMLLGRENREDAASYGVLAMSGKELVPFIYDDVKIENEYWAVGITLAPASEADHDYTGYSDGQEQYYQIAQADVYFVYAETAEKVATLTRDQMADMYASDTYLNILNRADGSVTTYDHTFQPVDSVKDIYTMQKETTKEDFAALDEAYGVIKEETAENENGVDEVRQRFRDSNGNYGVSDSKGNVVIPAGEYDYSIYEDRGYIRAYDYNREEDRTIHGLYDMDGNQIVPVEYDDIEANYYAPALETDVIDSDYHCAAGYFTVQAGGKIGYTLDGGTISCPLVYSEENMEYLAGAAFTIPGADGKLHLVSADGYDVALDNLYTESTRPLNYSSGMLWRGDGTNGYDIFDWHGNILFTGIYDSSVSGDGKYIILTDMNYNTALYEISYLTEGVEVPEAVLNENGLKTMDQGRPENAIDYTSESTTAGNRTVVETAKGVYLAKAGDLEASTIIDGTSLVAVSDANGNYGLETLFGESVTEYKYRSGFYNYNGYIDCAVNIEDIHQKGVLSTEGQELISCEYAMIDFISEKWLAGYKVVPADETDYDLEAYGYEHDYYKIETVDMYYIDENGVTMPGSFTRDQYGESYANDSYLNVMNRSGSVTTYDPTMQIAAENLTDVYTFPEEKEASLYQEFSNDAGDYGVADMSGNVVIPAIHDGFNFYEVENGYIEAYDIDENTRKYSYGLYDLQGNQVLPTAFDYIHTSGSYAPEADGAQVYSDKYTSFGYYIVEIDEKYGLAAENGDVFLSSYSDYETKGGAAILAVADDGSYHMVSGDGYDTEISSVYNYIYPLEYSAGMLWTASSDNGKDLLDWHGNILFSNFNRVSMSGDGRYLLVNTADGKNELYEVNYLEEISAPERSVPTEESVEAPAEEAEVSVGEAVEEPEVPEEAPIEAEPEAAGEEPEVSAEEETDASAEENENAAADSSSSAKTFLESAAVLAETNYAVSVDAIKVILTQAITILEQSNPNAVVVLNSTLDLIESGNGDGMTVKVLIDSAISLL